MNARRMAQDGRWAYFFLRQARQASRKWQSVGAPGLARRTVYVSAGCVLGRRFRTGRHGQAGLRAGGQEAGQAGRGRQVKAGRAGLGRAAWGSGGGGGGGERGASLGRHAKAADAGERV